LKESFDWNEKAKVRKLITQEEYAYIFGELTKLPKSINSLINIQMRNFRIKAARIIK
jgi:hypothetical protein